MMKVGKINEGTANEMIQVTDIEGDMGEDTRLALIQQPDGDVILCLFNVKKQYLESIEFCSSSGGGQMPIIAKKLRDLIAALVNEGT